MRLVRSTVRDHNQQAEEEFEQDANYFTNKRKRKKKENILISFGLKCAPISSYLHSSEAAAPVWIPAWKTLQPHPQTHSVFTHRAGGSICAQDDAKDKCRSSAIRNRISSTQSPLQPLRSSRDTRHNRLAVCRHVRPADRVSAPLTLLLRSCAQMEAYMNVWTQRSPAALLY